MRSWVISCDCRHIPRVVICITLQDYRDFYAVIWNTKPHPGMANGLSRPDEGCNKEYP